MGLFLDAAKAWYDLKNTYYVFDVARKGKLKRIELSFLCEDFPHAAGMQYASDVDFGIKKSTYYGGKLIPALLNGIMDDKKIESARNWSLIDGRLNALINLQNTFDDDFDIFSFDSGKVRGYSRIDAEFIVKSSVVDAVYFIFLDERSGKYYCKSAFEKDQVDYTQNQSPMTLLYKKKVVDNEEIVIYKNKKYSLEDAFES